jgi:hypothetical protein
VYDSRTTEEEEAGTGEGSGRVRWAGYHVIALRKERRMAGKAVNEKMAPALLAFVVLLTPGLGAIDTPRDAKKVALAERFSLRVGESAVVESEALGLGFQGVSNDSRCPKGVKCFWEGDAAVQVWVRRASEAKEQRELHTSARGPADAGFENWSIRLVALDPYPVSGRAIRQEDYVATLEVTRGSPGEGEVR